MCRGVGTITPPSPAAPDSEPPLSPMGGRACKPAVEYGECVGLLRAGDLLVIQAQFSRLSSGGSSSRAAGRTSEPRVAKEAFVREVLRPRFPGCPPSVLERAFAVCDYGGSGAIEREEFVVALFVMQFGAREDRLQLLFNLFDLDANGQVSKKEMRRMIAPMAAAWNEGEEEDEEKMRTLAPLAEAATLLAFHQFDRNGDSNLNLAEWSRYADDDPTAQRLLAAWARVKFDERDVAAAKRVAEKRRAASGKR